MQFIGKATKTVALVGAAALAMTACSPSTSPTSTPTAGGGGETTGAPRAR
ncbi:hypothetical protein G7085_12685 [Tessaracoccus sp. HDW20]|nr:hypothetical protein [Tessaracoccus coleopterorum]NHB85189.1 hypothetical protein [Tessaracoccus coleopterorum]